MKFAKLVNVVKTFHVAAVNVENVVLEKSVSLTFVCVVVDLVVVGHMKSVSTDSVVVRRIHAINVTMHVNQMKPVWMENVFVYINVNKVILAVLFYQRQKKQDRSKIAELFTYFLSSLSLLPISVFKRWSMHGLLSMHLSSRLARPSM